MYKYLPVGTHLKKVENIIILCVSQTITYILEAVLSSDFMNYVYLETKKLYSAFIFIFMRADALIKLSKTILASIIILKSADESLKNKLLKIINMHLFIANRENIPLEIFLITILLSFYLPTGNLLVDLVRLVDHFGGLGQEKVTVEQKLQHARRQGQTIHVHFVQVQMHVYYVGQMDYLVDEE